MDLVDILTQLANASLQLYISYMFFGAFMERKYSRGFSVLVLALESTVLTVPFVFLKETVIPIGIMVVFTFLTTFLFYAKIPQRLIYSAIVLAIGIFTEIIIGVLLKLIFKYDFGKEGIMFIMGMLISKLMFFGVVLIVKLGKHSVLPKDYMKSHFYIFLFPISTFVIAFLQYVMLLNNPEQSKAMSFAILIAYTFLIFSNVIVFEFIDSLYKNTISESKLSTANEIINSQTDRYGALLEHSSDVRKIRHDFKNLCLGLISQLDEGNTKDVRARLLEEAELCSRDDLMHKNILYSIVDIKRQRAESIGAKITVDCPEFENISIQPTDLAILVGNAIDNAIDACSAIEGDLEKEISISLFKKAQNVFIIIKNPTAAPVDVSDLSSTKADSRSHGFGIMSMKQVASKYNGEILFSYEDGIFAATVILKETKK